MVEKTLGDVATYINGRAFKPQEWETSGRPIIRIQNLTNSTQECNRTTKQFEEKYRISDGDLLFAWSASLGAHIWHGEDGWLNQHIFKVIPNESIDKIYLYYYLLYVVDQLYAKTHGSGMVHITLKPFKSTRIMLPELNEQRRVVGKIESLFAKLDEAKEKAQAVVDSFETRKAAILHKAFTGELTAKWREEHGVSIDNWKTTRFDSVAAIRSNLVDPAEYQSFPHIAPDNIEKKTGVLLEYHTIAEDGVTSGKHRFYSGQILYSKIRPYLSKAVVVDFDGLCSADMYPIEAYQNARCLWYYMLSDEFLLQASTAGSRSVLPKINQKELSALTVHLPTNDREQEEIARILDELFDKEQQTKEAAEIVLDQIELMKKSILARAFRGELGTNDPNEESAVELIKQIKQDSLGKISGDTLEKKRVKKKVEVGLVAKSIMQALSAGAKLTPENLKAETALPIDDFYDQLKILINGGHVIETRIDGESYLEAKDENR